MHKTSLTEPVTGGRGLQLLPSLLAERGAAWANSNSGSSEEREAGVVHCCVLICWESKWGNVGPGD